jgi:hypothetical protein
MPARPAGTWGGAWLAPAPLSVAPAEQTRTSYGMHYLDIDRCVDCRPNEDSSTRAQRSVCARRRAAPGPLTDPSNARWPLTPHTTPSACLWGMPCAMRHESKKMEQEEEARRDGSRGESLARKVRRTRTSEDTVCCRMKIVPDRSPVGAVLRALLACKTYLRQHSINLIVSDRAVTISILPACWLPSGPGVAVIVCRRVLLCVRN